MKIKDRIKFLVGSIRCLIKGVNIPRGGIYW